jgi:hypothetical protein
MSFIQTNYQELGDNLKSRTPRTVTELEQFLSAVHANQQDIRGWRTHVARGIIQVEAQHAGDHKIPALFLVPKRGKEPFLKMRLERLLSESRLGFSPSTSSALAIWDMLDPARRNG